jgi:hypothetical protein
VVVLVDGGEDGAVVGEDGGEARGDGRSVAYMF